MLILSLLVAPAITPAAMKYIGTCNRGADAMSIINGIYHIRHSLSLGDRVAMRFAAAMSTMAVVMGVANLPRWPSVVIIVLLPIQVILTAWMLFLSYRPTKKKQERVIAKAMLLGMEIRTVYRDDEIEAGAAQRYLYGPWEVTSYPMMRTVYDAAASYLREVKGQ